MKKLTKEQERGVDLVIKAITKSFNFIKGGQVSENYEKYIKLHIIFTFCSGEYRKWGHWDSNS